MRQRWARRSASVAGMFGPVDDVHGCVGLFLEKLLQEGVEEQAEVADVLDAGALGVVPAEDVE